MTRSDLDLVRRWIAARIRLTLRSPRALLFTFAFPALILLLFGSLNSGANVAAPGSGGGDVAFVQFYAPALATFALCTACYTTLVIAVAYAREAGLLKRVRGTPLPMVTYLSSWLVGAALTGIAAVVLMLVVAVAVLDLHVYARMLPAAAVTIGLGAATMAALGLAVSSVVRTADQATPVAQLTFLPLTFISGIWWPLAGAPSWLSTIANVFPLAHLADALGGCFAPQTTGGGWAPGDLAVLAAWGAAGLLVAARRFRIEADPAIRTRAGSARTA
jgi:ABC-2 type transport system permease protein